MSDREDLLKPSLDGETGPSTTIFSPATGFVSGFLGGPVAAVVVGGVNAYRLGRLSRDFPIVLAAFMCAIGLGMLLWSRGGVAWLDKHFLPGATMSLVRLAGVVCFGLFYQLHRQHYRNMQIYAFPAPPGWGVGIIAIVFGVASTVAIRLVTR